MSAQHQQEPGFLRNPKVRAAGALLLLACALAYGWSQVSKYTRGLPPKPFRPLAPSPAAIMAAQGQAGARAPQLPDLRVTMPSVEERRAIMNDLMGKVSATAEQRKKIEEIWIAGYKSPEMLFDRIAASEKVLTPEQLRQIQPYFLAQVFSRVGKMRNMMKPQDFTSFNQRLLTVLQPPPKPAGVPPQPPRK